MKVIKTIPELRNEIKKTGLAPVGLVPTMGALHEGHISLVRKALDQCQVVVVSIFVNPNQFNDKNDLKNYPRTIDNDLKILRNALRKTDLVFIPEVAEIYPEEDKRIFSFGNLDNVMEALHRPGHFNGVGQVVSRLFEITEPHYAYFGLKDFQQLAVIKELVRQLNFRVKIVPVPIMREADGLAMSSRNMLLDPVTRKMAPVIFKTLSEASKMIIDYDIPLIKSFVFSEINKVSGFEVEYFEVADDEELKPVNFKSEMIPGRVYFGCIAVKAGKIRLIDNIMLS